MMPRMWIYAIACVLSLGVLSPWVASAAQERKDICHLEDDGGYHILNIPRPAWKAHYKHGDIDLSTFYEDEDEDGYGITASTVEACEQTAGIASEDGDCDDTEASVNPGAAEIPGNDIDDDCDSDTPDEQEVTCPCIDEVENALEELAGDQAPVTFHQVIGDTYFINGGCNPNGEFGFIQVFPDLCELQNQAIDPLDVEQDCKDSDESSVFYGDAVYTDFEIPLGAGEQAVCIQEIEALLAD